jgi:hypothetical protein
MMPDVRNESQAVAVEQPIELKLTHIRKKFGG